MDGWVGGVVLGGEELSGWCGVGGWAYVHHVVCRGIAVSLLGSTVFSAALRTLKLCAIAGAFFDTRRQRRLFNINQSWLVQNVRMDAKQSGGTTLSLVHRERDTQKEALA